MCSRTYEALREVRQPERGSEEEMKVYWERGMVGATPDSMFYSSGGPFICFLRLALPVNRKSPIPTGSAPQKERGRQGNEDEKRESCWRGKEIQQCDRPRPEWWNAILFEDTRRIGSGKILFLYVAWVLPVRDRFRPPRSPQAGPHVAADIHISHRERLIKVVPQLL